jgi:hypothetical protein
MSVAPGRWTIPLALTLLGGVASAGELRLYPPELKKKQAACVTAKSKELAAMHLVSVDSQTPEGLSGAGKICLAPGPHELLFRGQRTLITSMSFSLSGGRVTSSKVEGHKEPAEARIKFEALAGRPYRLGCDHDGKCWVTDTRDGQKVGESGSGGKKR